MGAAVSWAQPKPVDGAVLPSTHVDREAQRQRIAVQRQRIEAEQAQAQDECLGRFAVTSCQTDVRARYREPLADLRRQELLLSDDERREKGAARRATLDQQTREHLEAESKPLPGPGEATTRPDPASQASQRAKDAADRASQQNNRRQEQRQSAAERNEKAAAATSQQQRYMERQRQAQEHREQNAKEQQQRAGKPAAKPLPVPPSP
ncbi:MAG TPA: hypothetical protein VGC24_07060 [Burkholderiaceae bacterium]